MRPPKKILALMVFFSMLTAAECTFASDLYLGASRWGFGKTGIRGEIDLRSAIFAEIEPIKAAGIDVKGLSEDQFPKIVQRIIQPYINKNLIVSINGKKRPVKVTRLTRDENSIYTIYASIDNLPLSKPANKVTIRYSLLFRETQGAHRNFAVGYFTDARDGALSALFSNAPPSLQYSFQTDARLWEFTLER